MYTLDQAAAAARLLISNDEQGTRIQTLPRDIAPSSRAEAYRAQAHWLARSAKPQAGWKIAATSVAGQKHIGVDGPLAGIYIAERAVKSGGAIPFGNNHMKVAEVEFAFVLGRDLPPRDTPYSEDEVFDAVSALHPAIEIPDSRYDRFETVGAAALIADNACASWMCLGDPMPETWRQTDLAAFQPVGRIAGKPDAPGKGSNVLGSPRIAMVWLVNELSAHGIRARAGEFVTTGTCVVPMPIVKGDHVSGDFGALGKVSVSLI